MEGNEVRFGRWALTVCLLVVAGVYLDALDVPFLWDDQLLVPALQSADVATIPAKGLFSLFSEPFWTSGGNHYYRPLVILSLVLDSGLNGQNPTGYHVTNLLLHLGNVALLYFLLRRSCASLSAGLAALVFGVSPRLIEAVAWISGRTDVLAATFVLSALVLYRRDRPVRIVLSGLALFCGLLCKEVAIAGLFALLAQDWCEGSKRKDKRARWLLWFVLLVAVTVYLILRTRVLGLSGSDNPPLGFGPRFSLVLEALGRYGYALLNPFQPQLLQGLYAERNRLFVGLGACVLVLLLVFIVTGSRRLLRHGKLDPSEGLPGVVLGAVSLGLVLHIIEFPVVVVSTDRFLYFPWLGLVWALGASHPGLWSRRAHLLLAGVVAVFSVATVVSVRNWTSEVRFWLTALQDSSPLESTPTNELGNVFSRGGFYTESLALFGARRDSLLDRETLRATNISRALVYLEHYDEARRLAGQACEGGTPAGCESLVFVQLATGHDREARALLSALAVTPKTRALASWAKELETKDGSSAPVPSSPDEAFRRAALRDRRGEALRLAKSGLAHSEGDQRAYLEYIIRFAPPVGLSEFLKDPRLQPFVDEALLGAARTREEDASELSQLWPEIQRTLERDRNELGK